MEASTSRTQTPGDGTDSDIGAAGDLTCPVCDASSDKISLENFKQVLGPLEDDVVQSILSNDESIEKMWCQKEFSLIEDYTTVSKALLDNMVVCEGFLSQMETHLSGLLREIDPVFMDIKNLEGEFVHTELKQENRKIAQSKLKKFIEDITISPQMIEVIVKGEVNDEYMETLKLLTKKLKFIKDDELINRSEGLKDVWPQLDKRREQVVLVVSDFILQKFQALTPTTNISIIQRSLLSNCKSAITILKELERDEYAKVRIAYVDKMNKVLSERFQGYIQALEKLQLHIANSDDFIGAEIRSTGLLPFTRGPPKNQIAVFALEDRISILMEIGQPELIPHLPEARLKKYHYEVLFRSLHQLLMDIASSVYTFCGEFFGEQSTELFSGSLAVIRGYFNPILQKSFDAIGLLLMIYIVHQHQVIMSGQKIPCLDSFLDEVKVDLGSRLKLVFDLHRRSIKDFQIEKQPENLVRPHYVVGRYAKFTASVIRLNVACQYEEFEMNMKNLRLAAADFIAKLSGGFPEIKEQFVCSTNNYWSIVEVLKEASPRASETQTYFEGLLTSCTTVFVETLVLEHFGSLIRVIKTEAPISVEEMEPLLKDFKNKWQKTFQLMRDEVITSFTSFQFAVSILSTAVTRVVNDYRRLSIWINGSPHRIHLKTHVVDVCDITSYIKEKVAL